MTNSVGSSEVVEVIENNSGIIHKLSYMYSNSTEELKDLRQEIIYQIVKSYRSFKGDSKVSTWVYKVALFTALSYLKSVKKSYPIEYDLPEIVDIKEEDDQWNDVLDEIKNFPPIDKSLIFLYLEDKSYKEMAEIMGMTESNIGVKLNRIKKKLKEKLN